MKKKSLSQNELILKDKLNSLFQEKGKNKNDLAKYLNVSLITINRYLKGENVPSFNQVLLICDFFSLSINELLSSSTEKIYLSNEEKEIIKAYRNQTREIKHAIKRVLNFK